MGARRAAARPVRLRPYRPADYAAVRELWASAGLRVGPTDTFARLERSRRRDPGLFLVAVAGPTVVGAVLGRWDGYRGSVHHLAVERARRGEGLGRRLLAELERRLRAKGCPKVNLHVEPENRRVVEFYVRRGYRERELVFLEKWIDPSVRPPGSAPTRSAGRPRRRRQPRDLPRSPTPGRRSFAGSRARRRPPKGS